MPAEILKPDESAIARFRKDGAVVLRGLLDEAWIARLRDGVARNLDDPGPYFTRNTPASEQGSFVDDYCNWRRIPEYRAALADSPLAEAAARLMRSRTARIFHEHVLVKEPGTRQRTPWHHDQPYYCVDGEQVVSFWIPLDPVSRDTTIEFVAGSHAWGRTFLPTKFKGPQYERSDPTLEPTPDIEAHREDYEILGWELAPGDAVAFHFLTLHGAPENTTPRRRRAFAARYLGDDAVYADRGGEVSPPFPEIVGRIPHGAPLPADLFPVVWPRE